MDKPICKEADLSRQTFYNVFDSKYEVLWFCLRQQYVKQFQRFSHQEVISAGEAVGAFAMVAENQNHLRLMIENQQEWPRCVLPCFYLEDRKYIFCIRIDISSGVKSYPRFIHSRRMEMQVEIWNSCQ